MTEMSTKEQNKYRDFKGTIKQLGAVDEDTLYSTMKQQQFLSNMMIFSGVLLMLIGLPLMLIVIGFFVFPLGLASLIVGVKRKGRMKRFATVYARDELGSSLTF